MNCRSIVSPEAIEAEYQRLGHTLGWRFLTCPQRNLETARVALVTINPGGNKAPVHGVWSVEAGSAYVIECWKGLALPGIARLQKQIRRMFEIMQVVPEEVLSGYLVPFRSPTWAKLPARKASMQFGLDLWEEVFARAPAETVVAFGKNCGEQLARRMKATPIQERRACWGAQTIDSYRFGGSTYLVVLPHLSHFSLFGREASEAAFRASLTSIRIAEADGPDRSSVTRPRRQA